MNRRTFIQQAGTFAAGAFVAPVFQARPRYKMGLQLYTMRAAMAADPAGTLKRVAGLGYEEFETYGFDPVGMRYYGMPAKEFVQRLRDLKLTTPSGHYDLNRYAGTPVEDLTKYVDQCIQGAKVLGAVIHHVAAAGRRLPHHREIQGGRGAAEPRRRAGEEGGTDAGVSQP